MFLYRILQYANAKFHFHFFVGIRNYANGYLTLRVKYFTFIAFIPFMKTIFLVIVHRWNNRHLSHKILFYLHINHCLTNRNWKRRKFFPALARMWSVLIAAEDAPWGNFPKSKWKWIKQLNDVHTFAISKEIKSKPNSWYPGTYKWNGFSDFAVVIYFFKQWHFLKI